MLSQQNLRVKSTKNILQEATQQKKLPRVTARYIEVEQRKDSDHHKGYLCYNCAYFVKPHHYAIVADEGVNTMGHSSRVISPHDCVVVYVPSKRDTWW